MRSLLRYWHRRLRGTPWRASVTESVGVSLVGLATIALGLTRPVPLAWQEPPPSSWWHALPLLLGAAVLLVKRRHPVAALLATLPILAVDVWLGGSIGMVLVLFDALYSAVLHSGPTAPRRLLTTVGGVIGAGAVASFIVTGNLQVSLWTLIQLFALLGTPLWWGMSVRQQKTLAELASARARDLQRLAELRHCQALQDERARMARDLHDGLSSNLSAIAIHSEAALQPAGASGAPDPARERRALTDIRAASLAALKQMRSMVLLLREGGGGTSPPARLAELPGLVDQARATGLDAHLRLEERDVRALPTETEHAAYRIVQEALTNAVKHCPGGRAGVAIHRNGDTLQVQVDSTPADAPIGVDQAGTGPGVGLTHMREWAEMLDGSLTAGWQETGGGRWQVRADLPLTAPA